MFYLTACDDECTGVLLDDLEKLYNHFLSVNMSDVAMAPYSQLVALENQTRDIQVDSHRDVFIDPECTTEPGDVWCCDLCFNMNNFLHLISL